MMCPHNGIRSAAGAGPHRNTKTPPHKLFSPHTQGGFRLTFSDGHVLRASETKPGRGSVSLAKILDRYGCTFTIRGES